MPMTLDEAGTLKVGDELEVDKTGQFFTITGIPPHTPNKITFLLVSENQQGTFIDETRLHLVSRAGTNYKRAEPENDLVRGEPDETASDVPANFPVDELTAALHVSAEDAVTDLTAREPEEAAELEAAKPPKEEKKPRGKKAK